MKITRAQLRNIIDTSIVSMLKESQGVGRPGELGIQTPSGQPDSSETSGEETDIDAEIEATTEEENDLRSQGTSPDVATKRNVLQRKLAMLKQKKADTADVVGESKIVKIIREELSRALLEQILDVPTRMDPDVHANWERQHQEDPSLPSPDEILIPDSDAVIDTAASAIDAAVAIGEILSDIDGMILRKNIKQIIDGSEAAINELRQMVRDHNDHYKVIASVNSRAAALYIFNQIIEYPREQLVAGNVFDRKISLQDCGHVDMNLVWDSREPEVRVSVGSGVYSTTVSYTIKELLFHYFTDTNYDSLKDDIYSQIVTEENRQKAVEAAGEEKTSELLEQLSDNLHQALSESKSTVLSNTAAGFDSVRQAIIDEPLLVLILWVSGDITFLWDLYLLQNPNYIADTISQTVEDTYGKVICEPFDVLNDVIGGLILLGAWEWGSDVAGKAGDVADVAGNVLGNVLDTVFGDDEDEDAEGEESVALPEPALGER